MERPTKTQLRRANSAPPPAPRPQAIGEEEQALLFGAAGVESDAPSADEAAPAAVRLPHDGATR